MSADTAGPVPGWTVQISFELRSPLSATGARAAADAVVDGLRHNSAAVTASGAKFTVTTSGAAAGPLGDAPRALAMAISDATAILQQYASVERLTHASVVTDDLIDRSQTWPR